MEIWNRAGCCGWRLKKFSIQVGDKDRAGVNPRCGNSRSLSVPEAKSGYFTCGLRGKYVFVQLERRDYLTLCEVKVWAENSYNTGIFSEPLAVEACAAGSGLGLSFERSDAKTFNKPGCAGGGAGSSPLSMFLT